MTNKLLVLSVCNRPDAPGVKRLVSSLTKWGWTYEIIQPIPWMGVLSKLIETKFNLLRYMDKGYSHLLFTDAFDTVVVGPPEELILPHHSILFSTEKACWPDHTLHGQYPTDMANSPWKYLNSGGYVGEINQLKRLLESCNPFTWEVSPNHPMLKIDKNFGWLDDQLWLTKRYLTTSAGTQPGQFINLDTNCQVFQTMAHSSPTDFTLHNNRPINTVTNTRPLFWHGNGHVGMSWIPEGVL